MTDATAAWPRIRPVGDCGMLVEFGDRIDEVVHAKVLALDAAVSADPPAGLRETVPAYASVMLVYDPLLTDPESLGEALSERLNAATKPVAAPRYHFVPVCYEGEGAPDLAEAAAKLGLSTEALIAAHLAGDYKVYMYGFAPGYAFLGGVPEAIRLPRKPVPVRSRPVGSVMIAGPQCLVTTLPMPTGWWVIGLSPFRVLDLDGDRPFRFDPGDHVRFERIGLADLERAMAA
jgi:inhibitor of KinA